MLVGLFKTLFILLTIYYLFKFIGRLALPYVMKKGFERMQQQQHNAANAYNEKVRREEGKVTIKQTEQKKTSGFSSENGGEYVDFEEVK